VANIASARKRAELAEIRRQRNQALRSRMRTAIRKVRLAIISGDYAASMEAFRGMQPEVDRMVTKGVVHKNAAARYKSRLNAQIKALMPQA